jgi:scyllo-inositol 2-dehydrogenase (NADP+)
VTNVEPSSSSRPRRVAVVGFGLAGSIFHAPFIHVTPGLELAAIVTRDATRQDAARREYPGVKVLDSLAPVLGGQVHCDLVVVATPNRSHVPLGLEAVRAGIGVVVDKPIGVSSHEARTLVAEARDRGVFLSVFQNRRWDGDFQTLSRLVADDTIGTPLRFESRFERWRLEPRPGWRESGAPEDAGGLLVDLGSHLIDQALVLFGSVTSVYAELDQRRPSVVVDDDAFVALEHESGVRSHLWMSVLASQVGPRFRLLGSRGSYVKFGLDGQEDALRNGERPGGPGWGEEPESRWGTLGSDAERHSHPTVKGSYEGFYRGVAAALRGDAPPPVDPAESVRVLEIIEAARTSAATKQIVRT